MWLFLTALGFSLFAERFEFIAAIVLVAASLTLLTRQAKTRWEHAWK